MTTRAMTIAAAVAASLALGGTAVAQTAQQANPTPMAPGTRAGDAPGMNPGNNTPGTTAQQVNPSPIPPGSQANQAPALNPTSRQAQAPGASPDAGAGQTGAPGLSVPGGRSADSGTVGGTGAQAPTGQPDVARGTAPAPTGGSMAQGTRTEPGAAPGGAATGATTPNPNAQGGGATSDTAPPAATTQHTEPRTGAAPVSGANSFTEGQARARMGDAGFNDVQELRLDDQGVWRGRGMRNGQQTGVALDYQGNVVATQ
jgi:hypothetical protein